VSTQGQGNSCLDLVPAVLLVGADPSLLNRYQRVDLVCSFRSSGKARYGASWYGQSCFALHKMKSLLMIEGADPFASSPHTLRPPQYHCNKPAPRATAPSQQCSVTLESSSGSYSGSSIVRYCHLFQAADLATPFVISQIMSYYNYNL